MTLHVLYPAARSRTEIGTYNTHIFGGHAYVDRALNALALGIDGRRDRAGKLMQLLLWML